MAYDLQNIHISSRGIALTAEQKEHIATKLNFIQRFAKYVIDVNVEVSRNPGESKELTYIVTLALIHGTIRAEEQGVDLYSVIDIAHDTLKLSLERYKDKHTEHTAFKAATIEEEAEEAEESAPVPPITPPDYKPHITKRITYSDNRPLHPAEAIEQMEMLGHSSFLFKDIETAKYGMVYKRKDGGYGLIEPEND
jgi:putative sigma-54 modulation protein